MLRLRNAILTLVIAAGTLLVGVAIGSSPASALGHPKSVDDNLTYSVTVAARTCPTYPDIMANRARNNIQESLRDLGPDSVYEDLQPIDPGIEQTNDPNCTPLDNWVFTLGSTGGGPKAQNLSQVTGASQVSTPTTSVALLDTNGDPTGQTIAGATTMTLSAAELALAQRHNLWIQGGTVGDPLLYGRSVNSDKTHGFGALRCAIDNLNGDNVEWIGYPTDQRHVFCFYYTVRPAPTAGTIIVRKQVSGGNATHTFAFNGNISYNPGGDFSLTTNGGTPASETFIRADTDPADPSTKWSFTELNDPFYQPTGPPVCTAPGGSAVTISGQQVTVSLVGLDTVTCTYTNQLRPTGPLELLKQSTGGVGAFGFQVQPPVGAAQDFTATTTDIATPVLVADAPNGGPTGVWTVTETPPANVGGTWSLSRVECNGVLVPHTGFSASLNVTVGVSESCTYFNVFAPAGAIVIHKITEGGVGTFTFPVVDLGDIVEGNNPEVGVVRATTTTPGTPVTATGDDLTGLDVYTSDNGTTSPGRLYAIAELSPPETDIGSWHPVAINCGSTQAALTADLTGVTVLLTPQHPVADCTVTNRFDPVSTVMITKTITGDPAARTGPVQIDLACNDGTATSLSVPVGPNGTFQLPEPYVFRQFPVSCTATESQTGAAPGAATSQSISVTTNGSSQPINGSTAAVTITAGQTIVVSFTNDYQSPPVTDAGAGSEAGAGESLADTATTHDTWLLVALATGLIFTGAALLSWTRFTRRRPV